MYRIFFCLFILFACTLPAQNNTAPKSSLNTVIIDAGHGSPDPGARGSYSNEANVVLKIALQLGEKLKKEFPDIKVVYTRDNEKLPRNLAQANLANRARAEIANEAKGDLFISIHADSEVQKYKKIFKGYKNVVVYVKNKKTGKKIKQTRRRAVYQRIPIPHTIRGSSFYIIAANKEHDKYESIKGNADIFFGEDEVSPYDVNSPEMLAFASLYSKRFFRKSYLFASLVNEEFKKMERPTFGVKQRRKGIWVLQATSMPSILIETGYICTPADEKYINSKEGQKSMIDAIVKAVKYYRMLIDKGQYEIPKNLLAPPNMPRAEAKDSVHEAVAMLEESNKKDTTLRRIYVENTRIKLEILNHIEGDRSTFNISASAMPLLESAEISHSTAKKIPVFIARGGSVSIAFSTETLHEADAGHLDVEIVDGEKTQHIELMIRPDRRVILPVLIKQE